MSSLRTLTDDMQYYHKAFDVYNRVADRLNVLGNWVDTELQQIVKGWDVNVTDQETLNVLSIGPGEGSIECRVLRVLHDRRKPCGQVHTTVLEPVAAMVEQFKARLVALTPQLADITYDWRTQTLEEFQATASNHATKFHFVSSVHSLYYVPDLEASLKDLYGRLESGGMMLIVVVSDKSGLGRLWKRLPHLQSTRGHYPTSAEIRAACASQGILVSQELTIPVRSDITCCFGQPGDLTEDGRLLLAFLGHVTHFVRDAPPSLLQEVREFLASDMCSERGNGGKVCFNGDWKALIIRK